MPNVHISRVPGLEPQLVQHLAAAGFGSSKEVLLSSIVDIMELLNLTQAQAVQLQRTVATHICPAWTSALALKHAQQVALSTMLPTLDACMRRGLPAGGITELVGPAGVGKSQMCFQLSLLCASPTSCGGLGATVLYIDTERKFSSSRFAEMAHMRFPQQLSDTAALDATMSRVIIITPRNSEELMHCLDTLEAGIIQHHASLVLVDSIASLARTEYYGSRETSGSGRHSIMDRQEMLGSVAAKLKYLAESFRIPVVVTNQVTTRMTGQVAAHSFQQQQQQPDGAGGGGYVTAALGTKWAHCVNLRIILERLADKRYLKVAKSAATANVALEYLITPMGMEEVVGADIPAELDTSDVLAMPIANEVDYHMG